MRAMALVMAAALVLGAGLAAAEEAKTPKLERFSGKVSEVKEAALTVVSKTDAGEKTMTFTVNAETKIMVPTGKTVEVTGEDGTKRTRPEMVEGKLADVKVDQRVYVGYKKDGDANVAVQIRVLPAPAPKPKEGGDTK